MKVADLSQEMLESLKQLRCDSAMRDEVVRILEKHEGPAHSHPALLSIAGDRASTDWSVRHPNITILLTI